MANKNFIWLGMVVGSTVGGFIPALWGDSFLSFSSLIFTALGGGAGIYLGFKVNEFLE